MAESYITKKALADALKDIMLETSFEKIKVAYICEKCKMNRKSFYYHFKDKYDLLNWIFDVEISEFIDDDYQNKTLDERIQDVRQVCEYFYNHRLFYRHALKVQGQNSFLEHVRELITLLMRTRLSSYLINAKDDFELNFFTDAVFIAFERWLSDENCMSPDEFVDHLIKLLQHVAEILNNELNNK